MSNPEKIWHEYLTELSTSGVMCSHFTLGNPKKSFSTLLFMYFRLFTLPQKKTNSNCCTAASAVYLLLFSACYYLHSPSTASGAHCRRSACIDMDMGHVEACGSGVLRHGLNLNTATVGRDHSTATLRSRPTECYRWHCCQMKTATATDDTHRSLDM